MKNSALQVNKELQLGKTSYQSKWQRVLLLIVLAYEGAGALLGGGLLIVGRDGKYMDMPVTIMHGSFQDFYIPGLILFVMGILNAVAFFAVLRRTSIDWIMAIAATGGMLIWFWVEIAILQELHWLHAMWGFPVVLGLIAAWPLIPLAFQKKVLLYCGILSSIHYVAINIIVPLQWKGYNSLSQVPSELSAINAPTRTLWLILATPYTFLMLAFAWGITKAAGRSRSLVLAAKCLFAYGALGFLWPLAPMHLRETLAAGGGTLSDTLHLALGAITEILYLLALVYASTALGKGFRSYSILTVVLVFFFGLLTFLESPGLAKNQPTPLIGLWERINIGIFLVWISVLAVLLLHYQASDYNLNKNLTITNKDVVKRKIPSLDEN